MIEAGTSLFSVFRLERRGTDVLRKRALTHDPFRRALRPSTPLARPKRQQRAYVGKFAVVGGRGAGGTWLERKQTLPSIQRRDPESPSRDATRNIHTLKHPTAGKNGKTLRKNIKGDYSSSSRAAAAAQRRPSKKSMCVPTRRTHPHDPNDLTQLHNKTQQQHTQKHPPGDEGPVRPGRP